MESAQKRSQTGQASAEDGNDRCVKIRSCKGGSDCEADEAPNRRAAHLLRSDQSKPRCEPSGRNGCESTAENCAGEELSLAAPAAHDRAHYGANARQRPCQQHEPYSLHRASLPVKDSSRMRLTPSSGHPDRHCSTISGSLLLGPKFSIAL